MPSASGAPRGSAVADGGTLAGACRLAAWDALVAAGLPGELVAAVRVQPAGLDAVIAALASADGRDGAEALWARAAVATVGLLAALLAAAAGPSELDAGRAAARTLLEPLRKLPDARARLAVVTARGGRLAVQAPTPVHRELLAACVGGEPGDWRAAAGAWARRRDVLEAEEELQAWGIPAMAVDRRCGDDRVTEQAGDAPAVPAAGLRVVELGGLWAAPLAARLLGELGAEVVKVEASMRPDGARFGAGAHFAALNAGKRVLALDLRRQDDQAALLQLLGPATVVIENFPARVLGNLGVPPERIASTGAALVRLPASRERPDHRALGSVIELAAGLGLRGRNGLTCSPVPFTDAVAGAAAALHAVAAARRPGTVRVVGQLEDVAMRLPAAPAVVAFDRAGEPPVPRRVRAAVDGQLVEVSAAPWRVLA